MIRLKKILQPTDFSKDARYALEVACALARDQAAQVILLHVLPRPAAIGRDPQTQAFKEAHTDEDLHQYRQEMMAQLEKLRQEGSYLDVQPLLRDGDAAEAILHVAEQAPCDLIVMGSHGRSEMYQRMMGSVAAEVARKAACPIISVRIPTAALPNSGRPGITATEK
jgi:nucleotide-binding universal stress UspA family protein